jgi:hypothetical protein
MLAMVGREVPFASALFYVRPMMFNYMHTEETSGLRKSEDPGDLSIKKVTASAICGICTSILVTPMSQAPSVIAAYQQGHGATVAQAVRDI